MNQQYQSSNNKKQILVLTNLHELRVDKIKRHFYQYDCHFIANENLTLLQKIQRIKKIPNINQRLYNKINYFGIYKDSLLGRQKIESLSFLEDQLDLNVQISLLKQCPQQQLLNGGNQSQLLYLQLIKPYIDSIVKGKKIDYKESFINNTDIISFPQFKFDFKEYKNNLFLQANLIIKVQQKQTILTYLQSKKHQNKEVIKNLMKGKIIIQNYGMKNVFQIVDVHFDKNPNSKMQLTLDKTITFAQYYKQRYNITINDVNQLLLLVKNIKQSKFEQNEEVFMIPQLVSLYLTAEKSLQKQLFQKDIQNFINKQLKNKEQLISPFINVLAEKQIIKKSTLHLNAYPLKNVQIDIQNKSYVTEDGIFNFRGKFFKTVDIFNWAIAYSKTGDGVSDQNDCMKLFQLFKNICSQYGIKLKAQPGKISTGFTLQNWKDSIKKDKDQYGDPQILILFLKDEELPFYSQLTKYITSVLKFPSHLIKRNLVAQQNKKPNQMTADILLRIQAKIGGIPWSVVHENQLSQPNKLIHGGLYIERINKKWIISFVGSSNSQGKGFYSYHKSKIENINELQIKIQNIFMFWMKNFYINCKILPQTIILYLSVNFDHIFNQLRSILINKLNNLGKKIGSKIDKQGYDPYITLIEVYDRNNTEIYVNDYSGKDQSVLQKAPAGICITEFAKAKLQQFYLNSQRSNIPTKYFIVKRGKNLSYENIIDFTHQQCYDYLKFKNSIRIPAYLQYAYDLNSLPALLNVEKQFEDKMSRVPYFL